MKAFKILFLILFVHAAIGMANEPSAGGQAAHPALSKDKVDIPSEYIDPLLAAIQCLREQQPAAKPADFRIWIYRDDKAVAVAFNREIVVSKTSPMTVKPATESKGKPMVIYIDPATNHVIRWLYQR